MSNRTDWVDSDPSYEYGMIEYCISCCWPKEWEDCDQCGGEGRYEAYEDDPLWYNKDDTEPCAQCDGKGGWWVCINKACSADV
jgi:DnaJ-class molecular chaperone